MQLPKLKKINDPLTQSNRPRRRKILLLCDDIRFHSGIATMAREFVAGTAHQFEWVQLGAGQHHPDNGKVIDASAMINAKAKIDDAQVKIYAWTGYGDPDILRQLIATERPDAILHFTDPRFWEWLYQMEHEVRTYYGIPIMYYNIWDDAPVPHWNKPFYQSCDLIMNISKQTHNLVQMALGRDQCYDLDTNQGNGAAVKTAWVAHGVDTDTFCPITKDSDSTAVNALDTINKELGLDRYKFVVFWNNRNIRRKQPGDVILAYRRFCDRLSTKDANQCVLLMHTHPADPNGTDLLAVKHAVCPDYDVIIDGKLDRTPAEMSALYNIADVTINIASNEGFGISGIESLACGTPIVNNVTGGLQDHLRFEDEQGNWIVFDDTFTSNHGKKYRTCGSWGYPVFPSNRSLQGSLATPYIFDDRCDFEDVADGIMWWYMMDQSKRNFYGNLGREWILSEESGMSASWMSAKMGKHINDLLSTWSPPAKVDLIKVPDKPQPLTLGVYFETKKRTA